MSDSTSRNRENDLSTSTLVTGAYLKQAISTGVIVGGGTALETSPRKVRHPDFSRERLRLSQIVSALFHPVFDLQIFHFVHHGYIVNQLASHFLLLFFRAAGMKVRFASKNARSPLSMVSRTATFALSMAVASVESSLSNTVRT